MDSSLTQSQREELRITGFVPTAKAFIGSNVPWLFNVLFAHILFWVYGAPALIDYGYSDLNQDSSGSLQSGPSGSGVGIVSGLLMSIGTLVIIFKAV
ncbi:unnamed protein product, partial [Choristocarpus tenellus]